MAASGRHTRCVPPAPAWPCQAARQPWPCLPCSRPQDGNLGAPLHFGATAGSAALCAMLLQAGADPNIQDRMGLPPLFYALQGGFAGVAQVLLQAGAVGPQGTIVMLTQRHPCERVRGPSGAGPALLSTCACSRACSRAQHVAALTCWHANCCPSLPPRTVSADAPARAPRVCAHPSCGATAGLRKCGGCRAVRCCSEACCHAHACAKAERRSTPAAARQLGGQ